MQIRTEKVRLKNTDIRRIYFDAFPKKERMPFPLMVAMSKLWNTQFLSFYDGDIPCGLIYFALNNKMLFIMFLAVDSSLRSKGYGSAVLREIKNRYPDKKLIVSIEPCDDSAPDLELRNRRKAFYLSNGYQETGYMMKLNGVVQEILIFNGKFIKKEFRTFFAAYSNGTVWPKLWRQTESESGGQTPAGNSRTK